MQNHFSEKLERILVSCTRNYFHFIAHLDLYHKFCTGFPSSCFYLECEVIGDFD